MGGAFPVAIGVTSAGILDPFKTEIKRVGGTVCKGKVLLKQKLDAPRKHTPKENGCGSPRSLRIVFLWALGVRGWVSFD